MAQRRNSVRQQTRQVEVIRRHMAQIGATQQQVAIAMGLERLAIYRYLTGVRPMPEGMEARVNAALDLLKEEHRVAAEAEEKRVAKLAKAVEKLLTEAVEKVRAELEEEHRVAAEAVEKLRAERVEKLRRDEAK